jgi:RNA polymerase sigma-70 factor (ECF subfamily)
MPAAEAVTVETVTIEAVPVRAFAGKSDFVECYVMHYRRLVRALTLGGADPAAAEDLAQEAFARALVRWRRVSKGVNPPGYVYTTGFRLMQRWLQRARLWDIGTMPEVAAPALTDSLVTTSVVLETALAGMPPKRRACAVMCLIAGLSVHEAGEALGIADGTVRKHLDEARQTLGGVLS